MKWTIAWFLNQEERWKKRAEWAKNEKMEGHKCYAEKQVYVWEKMKDKCKQTWKYE
jgi:predicted choloylglycine hydrolase